MFHAHLRNRALGLITSLIVVFSMTLMSSEAANAATGFRLNHTVAKTAQGKMTSWVHGHTHNGRTVTGTFTPMKFTRHNGHERVRGVLTGVVHNRDGSIRTFTVLRTMRVKSMDGTPLAARTLSAAKATCGILDLVLAPLDLNLLGLKVHLDRVVLNVVAQSGAGNLLGNLLCSVTHLLDGGLGGLLGQLTTTLNAILARLGLGL